MGEGGGGINSNQWGRRLEGSPKTDVMDGPCRLPWWTTPFAPVYGWSITNRTQNTVMSYVTLGRHGPLWFQQWHKGMVLFHYSYFMRRPRYSGCSHCPAWPRLRLLSGFRYKVIPAWMKSPCTFEPCMLLSPEAKSLDEIQTKFLRIFSLATYTVTSTALPWDFHGFMIVNYWADW